MESSDNELFAKIESLDEFVQATNQALQAAVMHESNQAFNLGLRTWLIPASGLVIAVFVFSKANWVMAGIVAALAGLAAVVFALFVASRSKSKSPARIYKSHLSSLVHTKLISLENSPEEFAQRALEILPPEALLVQTLRQQDTNQVIHPPNSKEEVE